MDKKADFAQQLGKRIIELRERKGWSQSEFSRQANKDRQAIERIEKGKVVPNAYTLYDLACALEVDVCQLLNITDKK